MDANVSGDLSREVTDDRVHQPYATIAADLKRRIRHLESQSYTILFVIALIIGYGFYISGQGAATTASDIESVQQPAERSRIRLQQEIKLRNAMKGLEGRFGRYLVGVKDARGADYNLVPQLFRIDIKAALENIENVIPEGKIQFDLPPQCSSLEIPSRERLDSYLPAGSGESFIDFKKNFPRLTVATILPTAPTQSLAQLSADDRRRFAEEVKRGVASRCEDINSSLEFAEVKLAFVDFDKALESLTKAPTTPATPRPNSDINVVLLLALNKFGPFVIIFFFSSMLITLYKYNSRLVGFYYARLYAVSSTTAPIETDELNKLVAIYAPDRLDFGRPPRTPIDIAGDIAMKVADKLESRAEKK